MIEEKYAALAAAPSDINEHLPLLKQYAAECDTIVELGVRYIVSTWALLAGKPKMMISVDITHPKDYGGNLDEVEHACEEEDIVFTFIQADSRTINLPEHDFLFIDTIHTGEHLKAELEKHAHKARKYIGFHDTHLEGDTEMMDTINQFITLNPEWKIREDHKNNNGCTILARV
jgi:hypothetical protein